jgi:hypothetical protein
MAAPRDIKTGLYTHGGFLRHDSLYDIATGEPLDSGEPKRIVKELLTQTRVQWR